MKTNILVDLRDVKKSFDSITAVSNLSLTLKPGDLLGLTGPDGAGKTTLIRLMAGAMTPDSGKVIINGYSMETNPDQAREGLGYLSQNFSLYEDLTALENIRFFAEVRGLTAELWRPRAMEILSFVGLIEFKDRLTGNLSGGMKQKLGLASALVHQPQLLLLDEPTRGVDPVTRQDFWQLILRIVAEEGVGVIVSTPHMDEVARCHQVAMMKDGQFVLKGSTRELRSSLINRIIEIPGIGRAVDREKLFALPEIEDIQSFGENLHLRIRKSSPDMIQKIRKLYPDSQARQIKPTLEDVFIALMEERGEPNA
ncbi:MAG: ABC transporter ATP-binding protein [Anaerolineales bacterium]